MSRAPDAVHQDVGRAHVGDDPSERRVDVFVMSMIAPDHRHAIATFVILRS